MYDTFKPQADQATGEKTCKVPEKTQYYGKFRRPAFLVDKPQNQSTKGIPNYEDMPNETLVSSDTTLQQDQITLFELLAQTRAGLTQLEMIIAQNPELATIRMVDFNPTTPILKSVREAVWSIFNATGKFIGISTVSEPSNFFTKESARDAATTTHPKTAQELISEHPSIQNSMSKLRALTGKIDYKNPRGRGAINPVTWIERNLIDKGLLTKEDVNLLPLFAWREVSPKLSQALSDSKSSKK